MRHEYSDEPQFPQFGEVHIPPSCEREARASLLDSVPGQSYLVAQNLKFSLRTCVEAALKAVSNASAEATKLDHELHAITRKLAWTATTIVRPSDKTELTWHNLALAVLLSAVGVLGMIVSIVVLSDYVLASASDLIRDPISATLFASLPSLGAVALKSFEGRLGPRARWLYNVSVFSLGIASLLIFVGAAALTFAPDTSGLAAILTRGPRSDGLPGILLLLTTLICDATLGASILSGVGHLLSASQKSEEIPNPIHAVLFAEKLRLEELIAKCSRRRADAEDYISRAAAGRELTRHLAELDLCRARELFAQVQTAGQAFAMAVFFSGKEETP